MEEIKMEKEIRRYTKGKHPVYDQVFAFNKQDSLILNPERRANDHYWSWLQTDDMASVQKALRVWKGDENGEYFKDGIPYGAVIPLLRREIADLRDKVNDTKQRLQNEGFPPDQVAKHLQPDHEKLLEKEAAMDVARNEVVQIVQWIDDIKKKQEKQREIREVLPYGPRRSRSLKDGVLSEIDGQRVSKINGVLLIDDPKSPYDGMSIDDYHKLAEAWSKQRRQAERNKLKAMQDEARKKGEILPRQATPGGIRKVKRQNLPPWPDGVVNHKEKTKQKVKR